MRSASACVRRSRTKSEPGCSPSTWPPCRRVHASGTSPCLRLRHLHRTRRRLPEMALPQDRGVASPQERGAAALRAPTPVVAIVPVEAVAPAVAAMVAAVVAVAAVVVVAVVAVAAEAVVVAVVVAGVAADSFAHARPGPSCRCCEPVLIQPSLAVAPFPVRRRSRSITAAPAPSSSQKTNVRPRNTARVFPWQTAPRIDPDGSQPKARTAKAMPGPR